MLRLGLLFLSMIFGPIISIFAVDKELAESTKCVNFFRYYEKSLNIPEDALYSISLNETGKLHKEKKTKIVWPWTVNVEGKGFYFDSKPEAVKFVKQQIASGKESIDVGCMQINLKHHPNAFKSIEEAFTPKNNIEYAANFLVSKFMDLGTWGAAISHYHSATPHLGAKYKKNIIYIAQNIDKYKDAFKGEKARNRYKQPQVSQRFAYVKPVSSPRHLTSFSKMKRYRSDMMIYVPAKKPRTL